MANRNCSLLEFVLLLLLAGFLIHPSWAQRSSKVDLTFVPGFRPPPCVPCKPTQPLHNINCNCQDLVIMRIPNVPGLVNCIRIIELLCSKASGGTVNDFLMAMTATTQCMVRLTGLNMNYTDMSSYQLQGPRPGARLLEQLLGGLGEALDTLLSGLLGAGGPPGGGLLGQILSGGNLG